MAMCGNHLTVRTRKRDIGNLMTKTGMNKPMKEMSTLMCKQMMVLMMRSEVTNMRLSAIQKLVMYIKMMVHRTWLMVIDCTSLNYKLVMRMKDCYKRLMTRKEMLMSLMIVMMYAVNNMLMMPRIVMGTSSKVRMMKNGMGNSKLKMVNYRDLNVMGNYMLRMEMRRRLNRN